MTKTLFRAATAALLFGSAFSASAHDLECQKTAGLVRLDESGMPIFDVAPTGVLRVESYPAAIGFKITVHNLAADTSVVTGVSDPLLDPIAPKDTFGAAIGPGFSLAVGATAEEVVVVTVTSQEQCLDLFTGGATGGAAVCENAVENRCIVSHDMGSAECRAEVICAAPTLPGPGPLPRPVCRDTWAGVKQFGTSELDYGSAIALD